MSKTSRFDPNSNEHLEYVLKRAYKFSSGDLTIGSSEMMNDLCNALCNLIGDEEFQSFCREAHPANHHHVWTDEKKAELKEALEKMVEIERETAQAIHYPDCWDTTAYPTLLDALKEIGCNPDCCTN